MKEFDLKMIASLTKQQKENQIKLAEDSLKLLFEMQVNIYHLEQFSIDFQYVESLINNLRGYIQVLKD